MIKQWLIALSTRTKRVAPIYGLLVLAPWVGEYLLGNVSARHLVAIPFLIPLYGGGALLIREIARRTGRGWLTILLLGASYGIIEAGLVDQSMFNLTFMGWDSQAITPIPALGISAFNTITYVVGHAIWSISIPIAIVEMLTPSRRTTPWLGNWGLAFTTLFYLLGCYIIYQDMIETETFQATSAQQIGATLAALVCVGLAFILKPRQAVTSTTRYVPSLWLLGIGAFVASSIYVVRPESWFGVWFGLALIAAVAVLVVRWTQEPAWTIRHHHALVSGVLLTYAWLGFVLTLLTAPNDSVAWTGNVVFALAAVALVAYTGRFLRQRTTHEF